MTTITTYRTYTIRYVGRRSAIPFHIWDMFNPYEVVHKAISLDKAMEWIEKKIAKKAST
jgi:hypothetical protein